VGCKVKDEIVGFHGIGRLGPALDEEQRSQQDYTVEPSEGGCGDAIPRVRRARITAK
jgi:hypothetical protein